MIKFLNSLTEIRSTGRLIDMHERRKLMLAVDHMVNQINSLRFNRELRLGSWLNGYNLRSNRELGGSTRSTGLSTALGAVDRLVDRQSDLCSVLDPTCTVLEVFFLLSINRGLGTHFEGESC